MADQQPGDAAAREPEPTPVDPYDWASIPAVDPWAAEDPLGETVPLAPEPPSPPTHRIDRPAPTRIDRPMPRTMIDQPAPTQTPGRPAPTRFAEPPQQQAVPAGRVRPRAAPEAAGRRPFTPPPPEAARRRPLTPPAPAARPPATPPQRRRRRRRVRLVALVGLLLCAGATLAYRHIPVARQFPVRADLPQSFLDLARRDDDASKRATDRLAQEAAAAGSRSGGGFAGVYGDGAGKRVTVFGVTGWRLDPGKDVRTELDRLSGEFALGDIRSYPGDFGVYERCGVGRSNGHALVVCSWADHGSLATVLVTRRSLQESADLVAQLRTAVLIPGVIGRPWGIPLL